MRWLAALLAVLVATPAPAQMTRTRIDTGELQGKPSGKTGAFLGIPFAAPPTGANRWRAPQPAAAWTGVRQATGFGPDCLQDLVPNRGAIGPWTWEYLPQGPVSENCLFVNVWTPAAGKGAKLPVLFWIYGGGFTGGGSSLPLYDGTALASRGIIVVSVNYRLGIYGFFAHPELSREAGSSGDYAFLDQIAGLQWVRRNIAAFGGDPGKVTIMGQSAGAASVHALIASPMAKGLFRQAIAQSGSGMGRNYPSLQTVETMGAGFAAAAGARSLAELRALSPDQISATLHKPEMRGARWSPVAGTPVLPDEDKAVNLVPVLTGLTADEGSAISPEYRLDSAGGIREALVRRYGTFADRFAPLYPAPDPETAQASARLMARERGIAAMLAWARSRPAGAPPVYGYLWTYAEPGSKPEYRAFHSAELAYVFGTLSVTPERPFTDRDRMISQMTGDYWAGFVKTGIPGRPGLPAWPTIDGGQIMLLGPAFGAMQPMRPEAQAQFDAFAAAGGRVTLF
ncbi:carboxylesterase family protein [Sphingomonas sp. LB-2]|uniref:carboxylesterase/lipase family protein n=1 Tax=Sphingomonas caeni TaxID=2984949 RepID=UPI00222EC0C8|nr:carboxylesterase family protein [Sphingomonas caeni]MCW3848930.1 carboxylesterase family protein [Sphingomonas caeni]